MRKQAVDVGANPNPNAREAILAAARLAAQCRGYAGLNFRELATTVGVKHASLYYHFPSKADLGAAVARRYWEDTAAVLEAMLGEAADPLVALSNYPKIFRASLENENRLCLVSFMSAEYDDLPHQVQAEVESFTTVNVAWLTKVLAATGLEPQAAAQRANAVYAAVAGAQLMARARCDIALFDALIDGYKSVDLIPR